MSKFFKAVKSDELFMEVEIKNNVMILQNVSNPTEPLKPVFMTTLKRWYKELTDEEVSEIMKSQGKKAPVTEAAPVEKTEKVKAEKKPKAEKAAKTEDEKPKEPKKNPTEKMAEQVLRVAKELLDDDAVIEDLFLVVKGVKILRVLKNGVSIKESIAKDSVFGYVRKGYNHPFKAKIVDVSDNDLKAIITYVISTLPVSE